MESIVYIVDDDRLARESLEWLVDSVHIPVKVYENGYELLEHNKDGLSGCIVLDVRMPEINGMDLHRKLKQEGCDVPVIIMTGHADVAMAVRAMKSGAYDFIEKPYNDSLMLERIQSAMTYDADRRKESERVDEIKQRLHSLTPREHEVLLHILESRLNKVIAHEMGISIKTVELHRANLMNKMEATSATELVRLSLIAGLV